MPRAAVMCVTLKLTVVYAYHYFHQLRELAHEDRAYRSLSVDRQQQQRDIIVQRVQQAWYDHVAVRHAATTCPLIRSSCLHSTSLNEVINAERTSEIGTFSLVAPPSPVLHPS